MDQVDPQWVGIKVALGENMMWHAIRAFHLAGRCAGCNECQRVCPLNIPMDLLNEKLDHEVARLFQFRPGTSPDEAPPLTTFEKSERLEVTG